MAGTVHYRGTRPEAEEAARQLGAMLAGTVPDPQGFARGIQLRAGVALLSEVQRDFLVKSRGGTGRDGIKWAPLKPETIARRRTTRAERKGLGIGKGRRPSLSPAQDARWRAIYRRTLQAALVDLAPKEAKARAAAIAWATLKKEGAKTKLELLGSRVVDIGRDTGRMLRSLTPGVEDRPAKEAEQVFEVEPGAVIVGSNVPYFGRFNEARPVWPADGSIPAAWWPGIDRAILSGYAEALARMLGA